jgi:ribosome maturation factor RimP
MVELVSKLAKWSSDFLEGSEQFLVEVENKPGSDKYRIYIDGLEPISIGRCAELSRHVSKLIDEDTELGDDEYFTFEVSSPGADRPLKLIKQFYKHIGRQFAIEMNDGREVSGVLKSIDGDNLLITTKISKKETADEQIDFKDTKEVSIIISFK